MDSAPTASINYECKGENNCAYSVNIKQNQSTIDISIKDKSSVACEKYKISLSLEELCTLNKYYKQFDSIQEAYKDFSGINNISELTSIVLDKNLVKFCLTIPYISKTIPNNKLDLMIKSEKIHENDILLNLSEKVKEIELLKKKCDYLFYLLGKTNKDFESYQQIKDNISNLTEKIQKSKVIKLDDLIIVQEGILKKINKNIKNLKLLYRASRDGDSSHTFHSACDGLSNTVTFVKSKSGRKFGGFSEKAWNSTGSYYIDNNTFLFSLDTKECYFYKKGNKCMYGYSFYGPVWGNGYDLYLADNCLSNKNSCSNQSNSFEYNEKSNCLSGVSNFQTDDYETYQLFF